MRRRIRIAQVVGNLETGGTQALLIEIMRRLDRDRFDPFLIHFKEPNHFAAEVKEKGWECHKLHASRSYRVGELRRLGRQLAELKPDIVHTHSDFANFAARAAAIHAGLPHTVVHYQNTYEHRMDPVFQAMEAHLSPYTDAFIACSAGVEDYILKTLDLSGRPIRRLCNSVDVARYEAAGRDRTGARERLGVPQDVFHILHTARLEPHKQPEQLLRALSLSTVRKDRSLGNWRATFVGGGSLREELDRELDRLDAAAVAAGGEAIRPRVHFAGWSSDIASWLAASDVFTLVSRNEGLPLSLVEAMAAGTATVAPNIVGPQEVVTPGIDGLLVDSGKHEEILEALWKLSTDTALRTRVVDAGRVRAQAFSVERLVQELGLFYEEVASAPGLPRQKPSNFLNRLLFLLEFRRIARRSRRVPK